MTLGELDELNYKRNCYKTVLGPEKKCICIKLIPYKTHNYIFVTTDSAIFYFQFFFLPRLKSSHTLELPVKC